MKGGSMKGGSMTRPDAHALERTPTTTLGDVLDFMRLFWRLDHALQKTSKRMEGTLGVTAPQRLVIRIVGRFPGIPAGELAALLHVHPSTLTGILQRLERQKRVRRRVDPRDARRSLLSLTEDGRSFDNAAAGTVEDAVERALRRTTPKRIRAAREVLGAVTDSLTDAAAQR